VFAIDQQRAGQADGDLGHAEHAFDVAGHFLRVEGVLPGVIELTPVVSSMKCCRFSMISGL
jgi:hypothetical protein